MSEEVRKHPSNVSGKYYIDEDACTDCAACLDEAPNNITDKTPDNISFSLYYFFKQPETIEEEAQCQMAMRVCPVEAIRDDG